MHQRPQRETPPAIRLQPEIDPHPLGPRFDGGGSQRGQIGGAEIAEELIVEIHGPMLAEGRAGRKIRSAEHTSELQSLMRISYAVSCLKNTTSTTTTHKIPKK